MKTIYERVVVASGIDCRRGDDKIAVVHACKSPCHQRAVGYSGNLPNSHHYYLWLRDESDLYLNIIDPPVPLFPDELFVQFLSFAREIWDSEKTLFIHCNLGESRAPSLALIFLAKHLQVISNDNFESARKEFLQLFPHYLPGRGIETYLTNNWKEIDNF
jgi:hypothetical protein